ncbi:DUF6708 domain-containing protein [Achromobacter sp. ES-001]|uniref:DUF6708 domain-containing protein n=1 Tax=Achromobacter sp. ES-001 TaxID=2860286 RepID=UPI002104B576|nr:DUF6708 domain-containing protein [Achromobacter sp. ES-001]
MDGERAEVQPHHAPTLNALNDAYLEISRRSTKMRGLLMFFAIFPICFTLAVLAMACSSWEHGIVFSLQILAPGIMTGAMAYHCIRIDTAIPRDEPVRFNRLRRTVYVYSFEHVWWNPFAKWQVTTKSYDWTDLRAEVWRQRGATGQGGLMISWGVSVAVVKPGTNQVIDRFPLSVYQDEGSSWDYVRAYMQYGVDAVPPVREFNDPNEVPSHNLALRLAPKVEWPAAMDVESRTGPA